MFESTAARRRPFGRGDGFTIIELMITVAVASILLAIAVPSFNQMIVSGRLTAQTNEMITGMTIARSEAIKRNANITFCRARDTTITTCEGSSGAWQAWIVRSSATGNVLHRGVINTFNDTLVVQSTLVNDQVEYGPDGLARTGGTTLNDHAVTICSRRTIDRNRRWIVMGAGSRMSTQSSSGAC